MFLSCSGMGLHLPPPQAFPRPSERADFGARGGIGSEHAQISDRERLGTRQGLHNQIVRIIIKTKLVNRNRRPQYNILFRILSKYSRSSHKWIPSGNRKSARIRSRPLTRVSSQSPGSESFDFTCKWRQLR